MWPKTKLLRILIMNSGGSNTTKDIYWVNSPLTVTNLDSGGVGHIRRLHRRTGCSRQTESIPAETKGGQLPFFFH